MRYLRKIQILSLIELVVLFFQAVAFVSSVVFLEFISIPLMLLIAFYIGVNYIKMRWSGE